MAHIVLGEIEISLVRDGAYYWDGGVMFGVVPKTLWSRKLQADELNRIPFAFNSYVLRIGSHTILIETGGGDKMDTRARERMKLPPVSEPLPAVLARRGIDPEKIDIVINSHLHWDHCGGNTILNGGVARPAFPNARYFAPRGEWEHAHLRLSRDRVSYIDANYDPLLEAGRMFLIDGDFEVAPGVWMRPAPGHTRDLSIVTATSGGRTFGFLSDMVPMAAHAQPTWVPAFDLYPLVSIETKSRWLAVAARDNWICGFAHEMELDFARIVTDPKTGFTAVAP
ncbi:MAG TPA: MBL fold metallo-hydrolase [Bryobacteraceae bacterium]|nr:MBL fold metallo-hydrolase [Bryobacteraceae bacterium]